MNILTRRAFLDRSFNAGFLAAVSSLIDIPVVMKQAVAQGIPTLNGKKVLFIFLRGANDALNSVIPVQDPAYYNMGTLANPRNPRPSLGISKDPTAGFNYGLTAQCFDPTEFLDAAGTARAANSPTFAYNYAIRLGNGFAGLHPSLKFLAPVFNAGDLAFVHRTGYPRQSRSHFDSQLYWETGTPNQRLVKDGIFYRAILESGLAGRAPLTGVSIQSALPVLLRGSHAAMTNLSDVNRYSLLGIPGGGGEAKAESSIAIGNNYASPARDYREFLNQHYSNLLGTLPLFNEIAAEMSRVFLDDQNTDNDVEPYNLFPLNNATNGGYEIHSNDPAKYVVDTNAYGFMRNLKAAALVLNKTEAFIAGTELGGFDTHDNQGGVTGAHANLQRRLGWAIYALRKYFLNNADRATWDNLVIVTLSEFGRTTVQNSNNGTDHAEAGLMFVAGGGVKGRTDSASGVYGCSPLDPIPWITGPANQAGGDGSMYGVSDRYLKRCIDYRSVLGEILRKHLGFDMDQLGRIIPGYADSREALLAGGTSTDGTPIMGEVGLL